MTEVLPGNMMTVNTEIPHQNFLNLTGLFKLCLPDDFTDSAVEALDHTVCPRPARLYQAVLNAVTGALLIKCLFSGRFTLSGRAETVSELLAVVGENS